MVYSMVCIISFLLQAETYRSDFTDERKDREKAHGALEKLRIEREEQEKQFQKQMAAVQQQMSELNKEHGELDFQRKKRVPKRS